MIVAVTATGNKPSDRIDDRFGRASYLVIYDFETGTFTAHDNAEQAEAVQGAGVQTALLVSSLGADVLLTSHCGPKAHTVLEEAGISIFSCPDGTVAEAVEAWAAERLEPLTTPDRSGHFRSS